MGLLGRKKTEPCWVDVAGEHDFRHSLEVQVDGTRYALLRAGDQVVCTQASCSHEYSPLVEGVVQDGEVYCEKHGSRFSLADGAVLNPPACENIRIFKCKLEAGRVFIFVP